MSPDRCSVLVRHLLYKCYIINIPFVRANDFLNVSKNGIFVEEAFPHGSQIFRSAKLTIDARIATCFFGNRANTKRAPKSARRHRAVCIHVLPHIPHSAQSFPPPRPNPEPVTFAFPMPRPRKASFSKLDRIACLEHTEKQISQ